MQIQQGIETLRSTAPSLINTLGMGLPRPTTTSTSPTTTSTTTTAATTTTTGNTSTSTTNTTTSTTPTNTTATNPEFYEVTDSLNIIEN